jgi:hypothetical protein
MRRLEQWLEWQSEHAAAFEALGRAEQAYHRAAGGTALGGESLELQKEALGEVEAARIRLDEIRIRKPA